jgi:hypothetical protein
VSPLKAPQQLDRPTPRKDMAHVHTSATLLEEALDQRTVMHLVVQRRRRSLPTNVHTIAASSRASSRISWLQALFLVVVRDRVDLRVCLFQKQFAARRLTPGRLDAVREHLCSSSAWMKLETPGGEKPPLGREKSRGLQNLDPGNRRAILLAEQKEKVAPLTACTAGHRG